MKKFTMVLGVLGLSACMALSVVAADTKVMSTGQAEMQKVSGTTAIKEKVETMTEQKAKETALEEAKGTGDSSSGSTGASGAANSSDSGNTGGGGGSSNSGDSGR